LLLLGAIEVVDPSRDRAIGVERWSEAECLRLAGERRLMRTAHHRTGNRVIDDREPRGRAASLHTGLDDILSELQIREPRDACGRVRGCWSERGAGLLPIDDDREAGRGGWRGRGRHPAAAPA